MHDGPARKGAGLLAMALACVLAVPAIGCSHAPPDETPEGAVRLFLDDLEAAEDDPAMMKKAYGLLGPAARANLEERAHHTSLLQGRQVAPWEMLAAGRFGLAFRPRSWPHPTIVGDRATVEVLGGDPATEHARVLCVKEAGGWRVEPGLPEP
ncbi:MAG TPA: hypothetical protein VGG39_21255 [Polyangiaceae bacterium]|jgi:hypothetical protein